MRTLLALCVLGLSVGLPHSARAADPTLPFEKYQLKNGLTVILSEDHRLPQVAVNVWYHVGAANQQPGKSGFAHLFEHMMFSGSKHLGPRPFQVLEGIGVTAGSMANGSTNFDRTNYYETVPANELPTALWLESDRMGFLLDTLDEKKLAIQRDVVSNERRQGVENRPYGLAGIALCDNLYPSPHPYFGCVIGSIKEIQGASMSDLKAFFHQYYAPNNASLAVVGDFDPAQVKALVEKYFGDLPAGAPVAKPSVPQPQLTKEVVLRMTDKAAAVGKLSLAWPGITPYHPDEAAGDVLAAILGRGNSSRLYRALVVEKQVASDVSAENGSLRLGGYFGIDVVARAGHKVSELQPLVDAMVNDVREKPVTQAEVDRAVRQLVASAVRRVERLGLKADLLNSYEMFTGDPGYLSKDLARYRAVTPQAVQAFAQKYLKPNQRLVIDDEPAPAASTTAGGR